MNAQKKIIADRIRNASTNLVHTNVSVWMATMEILLEAAKVREIINTFFLLYL